MLNRLNISPRPAHQVSEPGVPHARLPVLVQYQEKVVVYRPERFELAGRARNEFVNDGVGIALDLAVDPPDPLVHVLLVALADVYADELVSRRRPRFVVAVKREPDLERVTVLAGYPAFVDAEERVAAAVRPLKESFLRGPAPVEICAPQPERPAYEEDDENQEKYNGTCNIHETILTHGAPGHAGFYALRATRLRADKTIFTELKEDAWGRGRQGCGRREVRQVHSTGRVIILPFCKVILSGRMLVAKCFSLILKLKSQLLFKSSALRPMGIATPTFFSG